MSDYFTWKMESGQHQHIQQMAYHRCSRSPPNRAAMPTVPDHTMPFISVWAKENIVHVRKGEEWNFPRQNLDQCTTEQHSPSFDPMQACPESQTKSPDSGMPGSKQGSSRQPIGIFSPKGSSVRPPQDP
mmetsp:Transcript_40868/g.66214  ORF Transcript_40868/g.66214 Transcript_40868/m.66214 type:complete len:129 (-) Transcript_40868:283-669(-)